MSEIRKIKVSELPVQNELDNLHLHGIIPGTPGSVRVPIQRVIEVVDSKIDALDTKLAGSISEAVTALSNEIDDMNSGLIRSQSFSSMILLSQAEYDALAVKNDSTLYIILEG